MKEKGVPSGQINDYVIEKTGWWENKRRDTKDENQTGLQDTLSSPITKHQVLELSVRSRDRMDALWK